MYIMPITIICVLNIVLWDILSIPPNLSSFKDAVCNIKQNLITFIMEDFYFMYSILYCIYELFLMTYTTKRNRDDIFVLC